MKNLLLAGAALIALTSAGHAAVVFNASIGQGLTLTLNDVLPSNTYAPQSFAADNTLIGVEGDQYSNGALVAEKSATSCRLPSS